MEWIETTAATVDEAREMALDKLGVDLADAEVEVIEEPKQGLFGRTRGQARVRARVAPKAPRAKEDGSRRRPRRGGDKSGSEAKERTPEPAPAKRTDQGSDEGPADASSSGQERREGSGGARRPRPDQPVGSIDDVSDDVRAFLQGLVTAFGFESDVTTSVEDATVTGEVAAKLGLLVGPKGRTLDAIQELARASAARRAPSSARIKIDVGGYREARQEALQHLARQAADAVEADGVEVVLEPMSPADRKVVHDALNDLPAVSTRSAGNEPRRRVVVVPADGVAGADA